MDFEKLYTDHADWVYRKCFWYTRSRQDAQDLTHTIFLDISKKLPGFRGECSPFTWVYRITINHCCTYLRNHYRDRERFEPFDESCGENGILSTNDNCNQSIDLQSIMKIADSKTAKILYLTAVEGLTQDEAADIMGMSRRALNKRLASFRKKVEQFSGAEHNG